MRDRRNDWPGFLVVFLVGVFGCVMCGGWGVGFGDVLGVFIFGVGFGVGCVRACGYFCFVLGWWGWV